MATVLADEPFRRSYLESWKYPENLAITGTRTHRFSLEKYRKTLDAIEDDLCHPSGHADIAVPIRDLYGHDQDVKKRNLKGQQELENWLGISVDKELDPNDPLVLIRSHQPKCRFM